MVFHCKQFYYDIFRNLFDMKCRVEQVQWEMDNEFLGR